MKNIEECGFTRINPEDAVNMDFNPFKKIGKEWMLVTAGDEQKWNTMTASWGFAGVMWGKNMITTVIRPQRYTKEFIDRNDYFTVSFFKEEYRDALTFCGTNSGRKCDKAVGTGLVPIVVGLNDAQTVGFDQASMVIVCRKKYVQEMNPACFVTAEEDSRWYPDKDYHFQYIGEIVDIFVK